MGNRKQQVESFLDTVTEKEMEDYIKDRKVNLEWIRKFKKIQETRHESHLQRLADEINKKSHDINNSFYKLGNAWIIAFILNFFYDDDYKITDIKQHLKVLMDDDKQLKDYVYDIMKDF